MRQVIPEPDDPSQWIQDILLNPENFETRPAHFFPAGPFFMA
jgi:hypothetical protein